MKKDDTITYVDKGVIRTGTVDFTNYLGAGVMREGGKDSLSRDHIPKADWNKVK